MREPNGMYVGMSQCRIQLMQRSYSGNEEEGWDSLPADRLPDAFTHISLKELNSTEHRSGTESSTRRRRQSRALETLQL